MTDRWLKEVNELCADLHLRALGQADWQKKIEELFARVNLPDLLRSIDFDRLIRAVEYPDDSAAVIEVDLPRLSFGFRATSETAATFDVIADNLEPSRGFAYRMDFVDPDRAEILKDDTLRARRLDLAEALRLYGKS